MDDAKRGVKAWFRQTLAAFFKKGIMNSCGMCKNALLVKETMLKIKINKLMYFRVSVLAVICFVTGDD